MRMGRISDYQANTWLDGINFLWLALHFEDPDLSTDNTSEIFGGSYTRQKATMGAPSNRGIFNVGDIAFRGLPTVGITHIAGWSDQNKGNLLVSAELPKMFRATAGDTYTVPKNTFAISFG